MAGGLTSTSSCIFIVHVILYQIEHIIRDMCSAFEAVVCASHLVKYHSDVDFTVICI